MSRRGALFRDDDAQGLLTPAVVDGADVQDREGGMLAIAAPFGMFAFLLKRDADGGTHGPEFPRE